LKKKIYDIVFCGLPTFRIVLLCFCFSISQIVSAQKEPATEKIRVNPSAAMGGTVSQYIEKVNFIPFESTAESAFGNIDQLEITDKYYIILDNTDTQSILIFTKQGKFHAKIEGQKIYPQHPNFYSFKFDKQTNLIKINYAFDVFFFDLDGKLVTRHKSSIDQYFGTETSLGGKFSGHYSYSPQWPFPKTDNIGYELMVLEEGKLKQKYLPYATNVKYDDSEGSQSHIDFYPDYSSIDSAIYYTREYDYNIYRLTPHTLHAAYQFIFPLQVSLPKNFRTDTSFNGKRQKYLKGNRDLIYKVGNFYKSGDYLFFKALTDNFSNLSYIYNIHSQSLICINKIVSDASSYFLPVTDAEVGGLDFTNRGIMQFDGDSFYTSYSSLVLFYRMEASKNKHPQYPLSLLKYFSNKSNLKGNPVLVQIKFKPAL